MAPGARSQVGQTFLSAFRSLTVAARVPRSGLAFVVECGSLTSQAAPLKSRVLGASLRSDQQPPMCQGPESRVPRLCEPCADSHAGGGARTVCDGRTSCGMSHTSSCGCATLERRRSLQVFWWGRHSCLPVHLLALRAGMTVGAGIPQPRVARRAVGGCRRRRRTDHPLIKTSERALVRHDHQFSRQAITTRRIVNRLRHIPLRS
ncbi:hypothetical protein Mal4_09500 [Maioricimonas rarisocia]|uniref:Uncharacterized protein n=1 Tax=Maioricimonas rarisocia TaxID=2528026 RepID=A0A517Z2G5_9PLAN|nr:hypothetical protein Mal4_09500 [Maioricimonas rarisocia]